MTSRTAQWKRILGIAWPLIVANSFWNIQLTIDRIFLGQWSPDALGAAVAVMGVFWTPMALIQQTSSYSMTFVAQYFGANEHSKIGPSIWHAIYIGIIGGLLFFPLIPFAPDLFSLMGHSDRLQPLEVSYFQSLCFSAIPTAIVGATSGYFTGLGDSKVVIKINALGVVVNALLDYPLIFGKFGFPELGIAGAGYATSISVMLSALYGMALIYKHDKGSYGFRKGWPLQWDLIKRYLKYGVPSGFQWALEGLAFTVFLLVIGRLVDGDVALAASGVAITLMMLVILPVLGVAQATSVLVGQHLGEKKPEQAERDTYSGIQLAGAYILVVSSLFFLFPGTFIALFANDSDPIKWQQVSEAAVHILYFVAVFVAFDNLNLNLSFALKGAGDTRFVSVVALLVPWPIMVLPTWLLRDTPQGLYWAWSSALLYSALQAFVFFLRFKGGKWKTMSVIH